MVLNNILSFQASIGENVITSESLSAIRRISWPNVMVRSHSAASENIVHSTKSIDMCFSPFSIIWHEISTCLCFPQIEFYNSVDFCSTRKT